FHTRHHGYIHAAVLRAPLVEGCRADAQLPAKLRYRQAGLYPLERFHDLTIRKPRPLHLVELLNEKILLLNAPLLRGDYRTASVFVNNDVRFLHAARLSL